MKTVRSTAVKVDRSTYTATREDGKIFEAIRTIEWKTTYPAGKEKWKLTFKGFAVFESIWPGENREVGLTPMVNGRPEEYEMTVSDRKTRKSRRARVVLTPAPIDPPENPTAEELEEMGAMIDRPESPSSKVLGQR